MKNFKISIETSAEGKEEEMMDAEEAAEILAQAEEIKKNKELMKEVKGLSKKPKFSSIQDLRDFAGMKKEEPMEGDSMHEKMTPDDHAEDESKESRVKKSKNPTMVGRQLK